ncbi:hypothetical protein RND71_024595 [Anisodus tanguticus]|uniref:Uncharacterized protein n=1 Tax=Anisodus tanguticus TaxID=243964 RepID=A0AAE1RQZ7_9SOLA|nr:hypothetical protein RND71_024595 [Anisodus tanguticus]
MMNVLAISLVLTTLFTARFFKPNSEHNKKEDVVLVVEFDKDNGTKVLISPKDQAEIPSKGKPKSSISSPYVNQDQENGHESQTKPSAKGNAEKVKDTVTEASDKFPGLRLTTSLVLPRRPGGNSTGPSATITRGSPGNNRSTYQGGGPLLGIHILAPLDIEKYKIFSIRH